MAIAKVGDKSTNKKSTCDLVSDFLNSDIRFILAKKLIAPINNKNNVILVPCLTFKKIMGKKYKIILKNLTVNLIILVSQNLKLQF